MGKWTDMNPEIPWASCFLSRMLILYLERIGKDNEIDYHGVFRKAAKPIGMDDPKAFLKDYNNWVPSEVLGSLIRAAEKATGNIEIAYLAAKAYFQTNRAPSLLEIIARLLNNIEHILLCSNLWAGAYTNYLKLQCIRPPDSVESEVIFLSQFGSGVEPLPGNIHLIRGNYEGFTQLFDYVLEAACLEEISQIKLEVLARNFGSYHIKKEKDRLLIIETHSQKPIVEARKAFLTTETIPCKENEKANSEGKIVNLKRGMAGILAPRIETDPKRFNDAHEVYEIVRGGKLQNEGVSYTLTRGQFFNAPYFRHRFQWKSKARPKESPDVTRVRSEIVPLLFEHLRGHRETQRRLLQRTIENQTLSEDIEKLRTVIQSETEQFGMIGVSRKMRDLFEQVKLIAPSETIILIQGETGTGKELLARAIHQLSKRQNQGFFAVNCGALTESLLEAELFGYEKGAFTGAVSQKKGIFEAAHGGSLFLDEVGEISPAMQVKLLRLLENQEIQRVGGRETIPVDVRIISATNKDLKELVASGKFRSDLYYRLNVIALTVPPLRERNEDIPLLADHYLDLFSQKGRRRKPVLNPEALNALMNCPWPGNIRELRNVLERAVVMSRNHEISVDDVILPEGGRKGSLKLPGGTKKFRESIDHFKRSVIEETLKKTEGNQTKAAKMLGLQRTYLVRLIRLLGVSTDR